MNKKSLILTALTISSPLVLALPTHALSYSAIGFSFSTNKNIVVNDLGFFDNGSGFIGSHGVGIYDSSQNLLVMGTVSQTDSLDGFFRYVSVNPTA